MENVNLSQEEQIKKVLEEHNEKIIAIERDYQKKLRKLNFKIFMARLKMFAEIVMMLYVALVFIDAVFYSVQPTNIEILIIIMWLLNKD